MPERLVLPIDRKDANENQRITAFADFIRAVYEGKGMRFQMPADELQQELEKGYGAPGEYSYIVTQTLFQRIKKEERPLFLQAIGTLIEDPQVPQYTKAALLHHYTMSNFIEIVDPSVVKLLDISPSSEVLEKSLEHYLLSKRMHDYTKYIDATATPRRKQKVLREKDYKLTKREREFSPNKSRKISDGWVIQHDKDIEDSYSFYPFGKPCDLEYRYLDLDILVNEDHTYRSLTAAWYDAHTLDDFLPVGNLFMKSILSEETRLTDYEGIQYDESPPGIYIHPDINSRMYHGERIYLPFTGQELTREMLEAALRTNAGFVNYSLDECSINILTPKGNQLDFEPYVPDDPDRHEINISFPLESRYFLQLHGLIRSDVTMQIITTNNHKRLPLQEIESILTQFELYNFRERRNNSTKH